MSTKFVLKSSFDPKSFKVDYKKELNDEQLRVVGSGEGHVLVLAGAGSGKTRTIVYRVAFLIERGVKPENILLVTFTNKAAKEMLFRVERLLGAFPKGLWGGTFHHVANLLLRRYARAIGYEPNFTILDEEDSKDLITVIVKELAIDPKKQRFPSAAVIQNLLSMARNTQMRIADLVEERRPDFLKVLDKLEAIEKNYAERKARNNLMDFDDLLVHLARLLEQNAVVREKLANQFRYILVDEYQDTNKLQASIVRQLASVHHNLLVVGDDAQSIYSFRGADISNILGFPKTFPNTATFKLEHNYRSTQPILDLANASITHNEDQFRKKLVHVREGKVRPALVPAASPKQEAEFIAEMILQLRDEGIPLQKMAVLFRAAYQSQTLEFELTRRDIPYEFRGGVRFFERAHIKDTIAFLKILSNPADEVAWLRVLNLQVGIGGQTAAAIYNQLAAAGNLPQNIVQLTPDLPSRAQAGWAAVQKTFRGLLTINYVQEPSALVSAIRKGEYREYLANQYPNFEERLEDLEQLALFAEQYTELEKFLAEVSLQESFGIQGAGEASKDDEAIILSTIHQAKGLEWEAVFVIHLVEPGFPNAKALDEERGLEEERRLFYVAVTRAMTHLYLTYPIADDYRLMSMRMHEPSRFLREVDEELFELYEVEEQPGDGAIFYDEDEGIFRRKE